MFSNLIYFYFDFLFVFVLMIILRRIFFIMKSCYQNNLLGNIINSNNFRKIKEYFSSFQLFHKLFFKYQYLKIQQKNILKFVSRLIHANNTIGLGLLYRFSAKKILSRSLYKQIFS